MLVGLVSVSGLTGCGTIVHGSTQKITVSSSPPGAKVLVDGEGSFTTPATVPLKRKRDHVIVFTMDGYQTEQVTVQSVVSGTVAGNLLFGGLIGGAVDLASGGAYRLVPEAFVVTMHPLAAGESVRAGSTELTTEDRLRNLDKLRTDELISEDEYKAMRKVILEDLGS